MKITRNQLRRLIKEETSRLNEAMSSTMKELDKLLKDNGWSPALRGDGTYYSKGELADDNYVELKITKGVNEGPSVDQMPEAWQQILGNLLD